MKHWTIAALMASALAAPAAAQDISMPGAPARPAPPPPQPGGPGPRGGMGMEMFRMADRNGDGVVTREEYVAAVDARFDRMDLNHDGVLQAGERPTMRPGAMARRGGRAGDMADAPPAPPPGDAAGAPPPPPPPAPPMRDVTKAQYREMAMRRFDRIDVNHDGRVDQQEMQSAAMMMQFRGVGREGPGGDMPPPPPPPPPAPQ